MTTTTDQTLAAKFTQAKSVFENGWKVGTYDWLQANAVGHSVTLVLADDAMNAAWIAAKRDPALTPQFDAALERWKSAHVEALRDFQARSGQ